MSRVLLVEDEFLVAMHIEDMLVDLGYKVVGPVSRLEDALKLVHSGEPIDAALLDVNLAGERSWPVARALRDRGIPFLFATGYIELHASRPDDLDGTAILPKPLQEIHLAQALKALLSSA
ncbi:hypothetical protein L288_11220 [Sphingobium quisquiliarum P25]|uniref:Response regulatory domain-containing protein n=1 Tax=Sphingobium quisquiliarum P25 TaxID=1329909 RepID=T0IA02_9SPHN|nr:response regulator [Sphingobium quisquiliarum]EQB06414.1 hypothetical protein L288_11220 [Sphingobium quisquiliarum P25]EZP74226.1 Chemotaxis protein CheY [Sphingomonas paucimobilis]